MPETLNNIDNPKLAKNFDSYVEDGRIIMIIKDYSQIHGEVVINKHYIPTNRANEIISDLQDAIKRLTSTK